MKALPLPKLIFWIVVNTGVKKAPSLVINMEGTEESNKVNYLEPSLEGTEEEKGDSIVLPNFSETNDILVQHAPISFFGCLALFLRGSKDDAGDVEMSSTQKLARLETRRRREMGSNDIADTQEGNAIDPIEEQFWVSHGVDVYTYTHQDQEHRLQVPAIMIFKNEKLIGSPAPRTSGGVGHRLSRMSFKKPDEASYRNEEPIRHTLLRHRNCNPNSLQSPVPITESLARQSDLYDDNETVVKNTKYEDVVKESRNIRRWLEWTDF